MTYEYRGDWLEAEVIHEEISVKGAEPVVEEVVVTHHGPIISGLAPDFIGDRALALRWTSLEPDQMFAALYRMNRATDCDSFREALRVWAAPVQNVVYADVHGEIAYSLAGKIPMRANGEGRVPVPGWTGEHEWRGYIPFEALPHWRNPEQGYIVTANNRVVGDDYPYYLGYDYCAGDRAQRIVELIECQTLLSLEAVQRMQFDQVSPSACSVAKVLGAVPVEDPQLVTIVALMREWDGSLSPESAEASIYKVFVQQMLALLLGDRLGDNLAVRYAGKGPVPGLQGGSLFGERSQEWLETVLDQPESKWFDLGGDETRSICVRRALRATLRVLEAELGPHRDSWGWGQLHRLTFAHRLGSAVPLDRVFNRGPFPVGGVRTRYGLLVDRDTTCAVSILRDRSIGWLSIWAISQTRWACSRRGSQSE